MYKRPLAVLLAAAILGGCSLSPGGEEQNAPPPAPPSAAAPSSLPGEEPPRQPPSPEPAAPAGDPLPPVWDTAEEVHPYLRQLVEERAARLLTPGMTDYEKAKAAFDSMIEETSMGDPIGPELWRVHGGGEEPVSFLEQRALSPLRFGVGMCEDYAAALTLLLRGMGLNAQYVPGLTFSAEGHLVDHAWTVVELDGTWYHLDCQLEDNISRRGTVRYRYFLRGDATLSASHRWGQNLIDSRLLTPEQAAEVAESWLAPACPQDYPAPPRYTFEEPPPPDLAALTAEAAEELAGWEAENGPLPPMTLNDVPPVFGLEGYGPPNEG